MQYSCKTDGGRHFAVIMDGKKVLSTSRPLESEDRAIRVRDHAANQGAKSFDDIGFGSGGRKPAAKPAVTAKPARKRK